MQHFAKTLGIVSCFALSASNSAGGEQVDANLECAALLSAANVLVTSGAAARDADLAKRGPGRSMLYLNAYAIPKRIGEAEAFKQVKSRRATLIETLPPADIMGRARRCADRNPR